MRKIKYIINPEAGKGEGKNSISIINDQMKKTDIEYEISISRYKGNVEEISREAVKKGFTDVIAVGGDGTVLETFNGIYGHNINLGVIPCGTGNDFIKTVKINKDFKEGIKNIIKGNIKTIDVGKVNDTYFLNVVGIGIDGDIVNKTEVVKKYLNGTSAYIFSTFNILLKYKCKKVEITIDGKTYKRETYLIAIGNGKYYGGGMMITPGAEINNEVFEIVILNKISKTKFAVLFSKVFTGQHVYENSVETFYGKNITIKSHESIKINADGNIINSLPAEIAIMPKSQNVIV